MRIHQTLEMPAKKKVKRRPATKAMKMKKPARAKYPTRKDCKKLQEIFLQQLGGNFEKSTWQGSDQSYSTPGGSPRPTFTDEDKTPSEGQADAGEEEVDEVGDKEILKGDWRNADGDLQKKLTKEDGKWQLHTKEDGKWQVKKSWTPKAKGSAKSSKDQVEEDPEDEEANVVLYSKKELLEHLQVTCPGQRPVKLFQQHLERQDIKPQVTKEVGLDGKKIVKYRWNLERYSY